MSRFRMAGRGLARLLLCGAVLLLLRPAMTLAGEALPEPSMPALSSPAKPSVEALADPGIWVEKTGTIRRELSKRRFRRWMGDTLLVLFVAEREEYTLLRGRNKLLVQALESLVGKRVSVTGPIVPASSRHPRPGLKVMHSIPLPDPVDGSVATFTKGVVP